jgi:hypothetical protein
VPRQRPDGDDSGARERLAGQLERNIEIVLATLRDAGSPLAALTAAMNLDDAVEQAIQMFVSDARHAGHTWQEIGELLAITRQAAQQRFARAPDAADPEQARRGERAVEIVRQLARHEWTAASTDWDETMRARLPVGQLAATWDRITASTGPLTDWGRPSVSRRGPFLVCEVPLVFEHGPMRARISFNRSGEVSGLFITLPDQ